VTGSNAPDDERRTLVVPKAAEGMRLDRYLAQALPGHSRRSLMKVIATGEVRANGLPAKAGLRLRAGDRLLVPPAAAEGAVAAAPRRATARRARLVDSRGVAGWQAIEPRAAPPRAAPTVAVLHRDDDLLVVSKPPGVPCHGGAGLGVVRTLLELLREDVLAGFGLLHRIDRDTSGCVALARDPKARASAAAAFRSASTASEEEASEEEASEEVASEEDGDASGEPSASVGKVYEALVEGVPEQASGTIDLPLADPGHGTRGRVDERRGKPARTEWELVEAFPGVLGTGAARLRVVPRTGRTHQIRIHLAAIGHPLLVDPLYGRRKGWRLVDPKGGTAARLARTPLHAADLSFPHPTTGALVSVHAPLFPDHRRALEVLRTAAGRARAPSAE
jgi:23S rRNA pseudouridine955/2504/2580 synthase